MNNLLEHRTLNASAPVRKQFSALINRLLYFLIWTLAIGALIMGMILLLCDIFLMSFPHAPLSAIPLLLVGVTYLGFQFLIKPQPLDLFKALIVSSAFLLWGVDQLLPAGWIATTLGDIVIVLYVIDLAWMVTDRLKQQWRDRHIIPEKLEDVKMSGSGEKPPLFTANEKSFSLPYINTCLVTRTAFLKPQRLTPLPCTCASPLAPFRSTTCCKEMQEAGSGL